MNIYLRIWFAAYRSYKRIYHPFIELGIRLSVAQSFLHYGMMEAINWHDVSHFIRNAASISLFELQHPSALGIGVKLACPIFFAFGLFTRIAALQMAIILIAVHTDYHDHDTTLLLLEILAGYVAFGARAISIDFLIAPGLADSAVPVLSTLIKATQTFTDYVGPVFQLVLRFWLGWTLLGLPGLPEFFPSETARHFLPFWMAVSGGLMIALGLGTSIANKALVVFLIGMQMMVGEPSGFWLILLIAQVGMLGAGRWSFDDYISAGVVNWMKPSHGIGATTDWPRVVIVGAGFGGLSCAAKLRHLPVRLTIVDRHNHHLFQPLLYQVATAGLSPADIASPIRSQFRDDPNVRVVMRTVTGIDVERKKVLTGGATLPYDMLVLATGAQHGYFGRDEWSRFAPGLKTVNNATTIRAKLLSAFENAENELDEAERNAWLTFVIVGGGPTGVELAGAIAELAQFGLQHEYRAIDPALANIYLVQSGPRLLPTFQAHLSDRAHRALEKFGITVKVGSRVEDIDDKGVTIDGKRLPAKTVLWAAGVVASPVSLWLGIQPGAAVRTIVDQHLRVPNHPDIFVIGDAAASLSGRDGTLTPGLAPAAQQGGRYVARMIRARLERRREPAPFAYRHRGSLATIGRKAAVADFGWASFWGAPAWWLWGIVHVSFLANMRNRVSVIVAWIWAYLTLRGGTRLITEQTSSKVDFTELV